MSCIQDNDETSVLRVIIPDIMVLSHLSYYSNQIKIDRNTFDVKDYLE
jgi:hypothetical protein